MTTDFNVETTLIIDRVLLGLPETGDQTLIPEFYYLTGTGTGPELLYFAGTGTGPELWYFTGTGTGSEI